MNAMLWFSLGLNAVLMFLMVRNTMVAHANAKACEEAEIELNRAIEITEGWRALYLNSVEHEREIVQARSDR